ncbi:bifunctional diaminohydroxyphosphoribosylaminopyrimidine deaminase/5-amino-6-(5-phosphoribosylamino)uracil reductase RibD [Acinetobacter rathckeae]|uniref:bifunctional diaminohydroxyphosphoribosylaminopyrimidine deaminase/5-amino-6-(5-phosphoribosylamino)uracil reductase RibD n=1 Tax=Acinetobacter rathckeae TaxID=2605272 RepID=UPI0018A30D26|nr:bifunctional diaminohydroxyphosphoribosylaminopyrimidine deaminase/5-amino-6-(5-phosphoribosylamino)uracil reductase RibD [Acinetobacter rathckeae]MBF7688317.1 bifunctional diaminohydroxyphosphoribosylaminopyrimidine deaminase/5-amino-6-(5-phosphoribosylamino)uracil reductase RibD [Acinetobacter rathckeae]MBF7695164.1 bifunctional diaminohydroxyphosphoribosylaminopyrimidine deaminase/5-amino-6-(5-phosphoribosylamino)uracil reductase RibD [Acinetobacter rathckeae]
MSEHFSVQEQQYMLEAITLAGQSPYATKPNPNVGCVLVKDGKIVGRGFHPKAGQPHAEVFALADAGEQAKGATAYVTLEPCAHFGKTPPCALALVKAGVKNVVIANLDPNPLVAGKGIDILKQAGISVRHGLCDAEAKKLNLGFLKAMAIGSPYVRLKIASSLDGRTAMASGESKWITGVEARQDVQHLRAISGAVVTGIDTVLADDCQLNVRELTGVDITSITQPKRVVLDRQGRLPLNAKILQHPEQTIVMTPFRSELEALGVIQIEPQPLSCLFQLLAKQYQIYDVLVEAGATLATACLEQGLVDEFIHYIAPTLLGQTARPMFNAQLDALVLQKRFKLNDITKIGQDVRLTMTPVTGGV